MYIKNSHCNDLSYHQINKILLIQFKLDLVLVQKILYLLVNVIYEDDLIENVTLLRKFELDSLLVYNILHYH